MTLIWKLIKYRALAGIAYRFIQRKQAERRAGTRIAA
jgi:hypothetical protein